jgi:hypothetical protein
VTVLETGETVSDWQHLATTRSKRRPASVTISSHLLDLVTLILLAVPASDGFFRTERQTFIAC